MEEEISLLSEEKSTTEMIFPTSVDKENRKDYLNIEIPLEGMI